MEQMVEHVIERKEPFDLRKAMVHVDGDSKLFQEMAGLFQDRYKKLLESARKAIVARDPKAIDFTAHVIQGTVANFAAHRAHELAKNLERIALENRMESLDGSYAELEAEMEKLAEALLRCVDEGTHENFNRRG